MELKCRIKGAEYPIMQGCTFTECYNETLDSGVICIDQVPLIKGLKPYDDVYIYDSGSEFAGYYAKGDMIGVKSTLGGSSTNKQVSVLSAFLYSDGDTNPADGKKWLSYAKSDNGMITLSGSLLDIFGYMYGNFQSASDRESRYPIRMPKITIKAKMHDISGNEYETSYYLSNAYDTASEAISAGIEDPYSKDVAIRLKEIDSGIGGGANVIGEGESLRFDSSENSLVFSGTVNTLIVKGDSASAASEIEPADGETANAEIHSLTIDSIELADGSLVYYNGWRIRNTVTLYGVPSFADGALHDVALSISLFGNEYEAKATVSGKTDSSFKVTVENPVYPGSVSEFTATRIGSTDSYSFEYSTIIYGEDDGELFFVFGVLGGVKKFSIETDSYSELPSGFYKHLLIDSFQKQRLNLGNSFSDSSVLYKYQINLMSETKRLEKVILPNVSITQPLDSKSKRSCWHYMKSFVELYSPKYKKSNGGDGKTWSYVDKYSLGDSDYGYINGKNGVVTDLESAFSGVICPEMTLSQPSLKDLLAQIMIAKDMIPMVFNGVIYGLDIGKTEYDDFVRKDEEKKKNWVNFDVGSMSSSNYATDARRGYSGALSQENSAHMIEYMGFRCPNSPFLTLADMVLETRFPIYKVNTLKMCYYKKFYLKIDGERKYEKVFLCKYDITPLVLQNVVRNALSTNWESYYNEETKKIDYTDITGMEGTYSQKLSEIAKYKLCTIGYDIGSNTISGWGTSYSYLTFLWFKNSVTYIENIINLVERISNIGSEVFESELAEENGKTYSIECEASGVDGIIPLVENAGSDNVANKLKSIIFEMDYDAMYSGTVMHSKDWCDDDDITTPDNCSTSLPILESDGIFEKEKMNRMSNETYKFTARYDGDEFENVQQLATYDSLTDSVIYTREYQIYDNAIFANYEAMHDYVMKNYFTSVWAKYRTYNLMSYGESITRAENRREFIILSKEKRYYETENLIGSEGTAKFLSFLEYTDTSTTGKTTNPYKINFGYFEINGHKYLSDVNSFACGNSICFNLATYDNISGGSNIESLSASIKWLEAFGTKDIVNNLSDVLGIVDILDLTVDENYEKFTNNYKATQGWYQMVASTVDAYTENVGVYICHLDENSYYKDGITSFSDKAPYDGGKKMMALPALPRDEDGADEPIGDYESEKIGNSFKLSKDNKEKIDFTYQFEYASADDDILISPWVAKLSDMVGAYGKHATETPIKNVVSDLVDANVFITQNKSSKAIDATMSFSPDDIAILRKNKDKNLYLSKDTISGFLSRTQGIMTFIGVYKEMTYFKVYSDSVTIKSIKLEDDDTITAVVSYYAKCMSWSQKYGLLENVDISKGSENAVDIPMSVSNSISLTLKLWKTDSDSYHYSTMADGGIGIGGVHSFIKTISVKNASGPSPIITTKDVYALPFYDNWQVTPGSWTPAIGDEISTSVGTMDENQTILPTNMILVKSTRLLRKTLVYDSFDSFPPYMTNITGMLEGSVAATAKAATVPAFFPIDGSAMTIGIRMGDFPILTDGAKSMQYYYRNESDGRYYFVFGANVTWNKNETVYVSCISKRNMAVYDSSHNAIGKAMNYADSGNSSLYGQGQYYTEDE